jgi:hypothetical protein
MMRLVLLGLAISAGFAVQQANAAKASRPDVPSAMRGVWGKHGRCDVDTERLTITAHTAGWGKGPFGAVDYDPQFKTISWAEEGAVDDFVIGRAPNILVHNTQGEHMPGEEGYVRCGPSLAREPWPPR